MLCTVIAQYYILQLRRNNDFESFIVVYDRARIKHKTTLIRHFFETQKTPFYYKQIFVSLGRKSKSLWHDHSAREFAVNPRNTIRFVLVVKIILYSKSASL